MKKILAISAIILLFGITDASSQIVRGFESEVNMGMAIETNAVDSFSIYLNTEYIGSYRFNRFVAVGAGTGITYSPYYNEYYNDTYTEYTEEVGIGVLIPFFAQVKVNFNSARVSPFFSFDAGYYGDLSNSGLEGAFVRPMIGLNIYFGRTKSWSLFFKAGVLFQDNNQYPGYYDDYYDNYYGNYIFVKPEFKFGFRF